MYKLKACPYCGNKNVKLKETEIRGLVNTTVYYIDCEAYACNRPQLEFYYKPEDAIEAWNSIERKEHNVCGGCYFFGIPQNKNEFPYCKIFYQTGKTGACFIDDPACESFFDKDILKTERTAANEQT